ncbi:putative pentatricopeptide repeat-containing protein [Acorus calamus]|uniref:Pentatricopeptide repeat-containing protein n=1 Tax=Acorus calamus TaxID=4465 RepID=A0AAV9DKF8_ACOCL|nr:putative pentatricopeptide repeat-containing protein [Acorus calamus]
MRASDAEPDNFTFACALRTSSDKADRATAKALHCAVVASGFGGDHVVNSALVSAYSKLGFAGDARRVFDALSEPDLVLWNSVMSGIGFWREGLELLKKMRYSGENPDGYTVVALLSWFGDPGLLGIGRAIHGFCSKSGLNGSDHVSSALVSMYSRCGCLNSAYQVFVSSSRPDLVTWSALITGFSRSGLHKEAMALFEEMNVASLRTPDPVLIASVLSSCAQLASIRQGREVHGYAFRWCIDEEVSVSSALISMYSKCGLPELALDVFKSTCERNVITHNSLIYGLGSNGFGIKAINAFHDMLIEGFRPDEATFSALLCACCHSRLIKEGQAFFTMMGRDFDINPQRDHYVYMVRLLGTVGELEAAYELIQTMPIAPDSGVWGALLWGCSFNGNSEMGEIAARNLIEIEPEKPAYRVMLSNMYATDHAWPNAEIVRERNIVVSLKKKPGLSWIECGTSR